MASLFKPKNYTWRTYVAASTSTNKILWAVVRTHLKDQRHEIFHLGMDNLEESIIRIRDVVSAFLNLFIDSQLNVAYTITCITVTLPSHPPSLLISCTQLSHILIVGGCFLKQTSCCFVPFLCNWGHFFKLFLLGYEVLGYKKQSVQRYKCQAILTLWMRPSRGFLGSIPTSSGIWGRQMKQCWITYIKISQPVSP